MPARAAPAFPVPPVIETATVPVNPVAVFPCWSSAVTRTAGAIVTPATVVVGWVVNTSFVAPPAVTSNGVLATLPRPLAEALSSYPVPARSTLRSENRATPATALTFRVPARVPLVGFVPRAIVTLPVNPVATLFSPSSAVTSTAGVIAAPAPVVRGWTVKIR